jgi:hypothetical protein
MTVTLLDRARGDVAPAGETKADARMPVNMKLRVNGRTRSRRPSGRRSKGFGAQALSRRSRRNTRGDLPMTRLKALRGDLLTTAAILALVGIMLWFMP